MAKSKNDTNLQKQIVEEEEAILERVRETLLRLRKSSVSVGDYDKEIISLRDAMAEEKAEDDRAMLMEQMDRLAALSQTAGRGASQMAIDPLSPYFAHMRYLNEKGDSRDVLIGKGTMIEGGIRIVDWRNAPISRVFYHWREGDAFDEEMGGRLRSGEITVRRTVTIIDARLMRVGGPDGTYIRTRDGSWRYSQEAESRLTGGAGSADRPDTAKPLLGSIDHDIRSDKHLAEISALLDKRQFDMITQPDSGLVVIKGTAGSGKTTVALHRIAYLNYFNPERYRPKNMLILVFSRALARYIAHVLPALGVQNVQVRTLDNWASTMKRKHYPKLTQHYTDDAPAAVVRFKTHRLMIPLLEQAVKRLPKYSIPDLFDELFTNRGWLGEAVETFAPGAFTDSELDRIHRWCSDQHFYRVEGGGMRDHDLPAYDPEDDMILLRLFQIKRGPLRHSANRWVNYDHLLIDEAQDFSPLELRVLLETVREGSITLAGDRAQKITEYNDFSDWTAVLAAIGQEHVELDTLKVSYRCTRPIMEAARAVLGPLADDEPVEAPRDGAPVELFRCGGMGEALTFLAETLSELIEREPNAGVAILTRFDYQADEVYRSLRDMGVQGMSRVRDQDFSFGPGIEVTDISQTKGLEFDYVIIMYVDFATFAQSPLSRHLLHVGMTRAIHQLWMFSWRPISPLIPDWIEPKVVG